MREPRPASAALAIVLAIVALVTLAIGIPTASGAADDGVAARPVPSGTNPDIDPVTGIDLTNLHLIESLPPVDRCLFDFGVFPRGGVGYPDSGLPYDDAPEPHKSFMTLRAEVLREMNESVAGVTWDADPGPPTLVTIAVKATSPLASRTHPEGFVANSTPAQGALMSLRAQGIRVQVVADAVGSMADMCGVHAFLNADEVREQLTAVLLPAESAGAGQEPNDADLGATILYFSGPDERAGVYSIEAIPELVEPLRELTARFGDLVRVEPISLF